MELICLKQNQILITNFVYCGKHLNQSNFIEYEKIADETEHLCNIKLNYITHY